MTTPRERQLSGLIPWQPGQSGNPGGRPSTKALSLTEYVRKYAEMPYAEVKLLDLDTLSTAEALAVKQLMASFETREDRHYTFDRVDGKPTVVVERTDEDRLALFQAEQQAFLTAIQTALLLKQQGLPALPEGEA